MEKHAGDSSSVRLNGWKALFGLVVPYLDRFVVWTCCKMWPISLVEIYRIDWTLVAWKCEVGLTISSQVPNFDGLVHGARCELREIFRIESEREDKMLVLVQCSFEWEASLVVPNLDFGIIRAGDYVWFRRVHNYRPNEVIMRFESLHLLHRIVVEYPHLEIVTARQNPMLAAEKLDRPDGESGGLESSYASLRVILLTLLE